MESALQNEQDIIRYIDEINDKIWNLRSSPANDYDPFLLSEEVLEKSKSINYQYGIARVMLNKALGIYIVQHNPELSMQLLNECLNMFMEMGEIKWVANTRLTLAIMCTSSGNPETALYHAVKGIQFYEADNANDSDTVMAYYITGTVYKDLKKYDDAERYYYKGIIPNCNPNLWTGRIYTSLANIFNERGDYEKALDHSFKSLNILETENNLIGISRAFSDIGNIYKKLKNFDSALEYFFKSLKIRDEINLKHFQLGSLIEIAGTYFELNNEKEALAYYLKAEPIANETSHHARLGLIYRQLAQLYKKQNDFLKSIDYYEKYIEHTQEQNKKERETKIESMQNALLQEKEQEIERLKNVELKNAYTLISEKNKEIMDSIHYAKRIQKALLASDDLLSSHLPGHFVFYRPKDIVSGDFYWATASSESGVRSLKKFNPEQPTPESQLFYLAVCDSTGHGVPGAFMSLLNITFLNEAINEKGIKEPHLILNHVRERLINSVSQDGGRDGMDGTLLCIKTFEDYAEVTYSSANNYPVLLSGNNVSVLNADKMPVGKGEKTHSFTLHSLKVKKGDTLYLFTDGYTDQFGGPRGKKFRYKQFETLLQNASLLPLNKQSALISDKFDEWKGDQEQVDDVLVVAIKF